ncbi:MAG: Gfo/Idh/MocA family oxidoreductase [Chitinophagaceae bacterium]
MKTNSSAVNPRYNPSHTYLSFVLLILVSVGQLASAQSPLKVALAGLTHDHVSGVLQKHRDGAISIIGVAESNPDLVLRYKTRYQLPDSIFFKDLGSLLKKVKPEAVLAYNAISEHAAVVEACAPLHIHVMVEKPLAITSKQAERMASLARQNNIHLLTNYETTWYASNQWVYRKVNDSSAIGDIRKMIVHDGHEGPKEIGVSKEFLQWLTDPVKNGAGALVDFGCYGANLMTWLMKGQAPVAVTAITRHIKPDIYPKVDDDATILLEYPTATGIIEASWNWSFSIKDLEVFGKTGYVQAVNANTIRLREKANLPYSIQRLDRAMPPYQDYTAYLTAVLRNEIKPGKDLSSLENNIIVVRILEAARQSASEGKRVVLK